MKHKIITFSKLGINKFDQILLKYGLQLLYKLYSSPSPQAYRLVNYWKEKKHLSLEQLQNLQFLKTESTDFVKN